MRGLRPIFWIFFISLVIWFIGAAAYQIPAFWEPLPKIMGNPADSPENIFAPVAAFFSGLSALATAYLIYLQINTISEERTIAHFFKLLDLHRKILEKLECKVSKERYDDGEKSKTIIIKGEAVIEHFCEILRYSYYYYNKNIDQNNDDIGATIIPDTKKYIKGYFQGGETILDELKSSGMMKERLEKILEAAFTAIGEKNNYCLEQYFHNIYIMIKLLNDNKHILKINDYFRTLRAELSQYEFMLIYYHAWMHKDHHNDEKKFKKLIEDNKFFHTFKKDVYFDMDEENVKLYEDSAFE